MITGTENLQQIANTGEHIKPIFDKYGLGNYLNPENLQKIGRFTKLNTVLKSKNIDIDAFVELINSASTTSEEAKPESALQENMHFSAMLPCGLRNPFKEFVESFLQEESDYVNQLNYLMEGNVNHELSYYPLLDSISNIDELPDIIMASDVNNFFHRPFLSRFIEKGAFESFKPYEWNTYLEKAGYADPNNHFTMYTANMLVMAVDKEKLNGRPMPQTWDDILSPEFENDIIMRGEDDFFCNAVMLPFYKDKGFDAIKILAKNIKSGMHPAEMVKMAGKNDPEGAAIYILPYFFSKRIKSKNVEVVWPTDGAIASPVFLLVKKGKMKEHKVLLDFLFSKDTAEMLKGRYFPATHPDVQQEEFPKDVKWLGWDFLTKNDIGKLKDDIRSEFMKVWTTK